NVLPVLKPINYFEAGKANERLVTREWQGDVMIGYAIRGEKAIRLLTHWDLERWSMCQGTLHELAIANLARLPWPERLEGARQSGGRLIMVATNDNFDASRLLH